MVKPLLLVVTLVVLFEGTRTEPDAKGGRGVGSILGTVGKFFGKEATKGAGDALLNIALDKIQEAQSRRFLDVDIDADTSVIVCRRSMLLEFLIETLEPLVEVIRDRELAATADTSTPSVRKLRHSSPEQEPENRQFPFSDEDSDATWGRRSAKHELFFDSGEEVQDDDHYAIQKNVNTNVIKARLWDPDTDNKHNSPSVVPGTPTLPWRGTLRPGSANNLL